MIGESHFRLGGERFVKGAARFVDDVQVPGMLHAAVLRSPHAHARLVSIDTKRARDQPSSADDGVHTNAWIAASEVSSILSPAKPATVWRNWSMSSPRAKSKPDHALGIIATDRSGR